ncbi:Uncharacterized protein FKW44_023266, partial [Caligus rogercresseyi]
LASSSLDSTVHIWDIDNANKIRSIESGPLDAWTVAFSPDSESLITGANAGKVNIFSVETGQSKQQLLDTRGKFILSIAYSPDGKYIASGATDGIINIFSMPTGKQIHALEGHALPIRTLAFSKDSKRLLTGSDDGHMKLYE